jgi:hypothetical protein
MCCFRTGGGATSGEAAAAANVSGIVAKANDLTMNNSDLLYGAIQNRLTLRQSEWHPK